MKLSNLIFLIILILNKKYKTNDKIYHIMHTNFIIKGIPSTKKNIISFIFSHYFKIDDIENYFSLNKDKNVNTLKEIYKLLNNFSFEANKKENLDVSDIVQMFKLKELYEVPRSLISEFLNENKYEMNTKKELRKMKNSIKDFEL